MKANVLVAAVFASTLVGSQAWKLADPGYRFVFPRDHFTHDEFQTEWWYYTGNLRAANGHRFGYELTFFRQASRESGPAVLEAPAWRPDQVYLAHLALSDIDGGQFFHTFRLNRAGPGLAGGDQHSSRYWNGNWQVRWLKPGVNDEMQLEAVCEDTTLTLHLRPQKKIVVQGENGISRKGPMPGEASHYLSFTRIATEGEITWRGKVYGVNGQSWMDHEFFTEPPDNTLEGWDWFAIQLDNGEELMLYRLRRNSPGGVDYSSGTYVDTQGGTKYFDALQIHLTPGRKWSRYPIEWHISIPSLSLELHETTDLPNQELAGKDNTTPSYWEGAVIYRGTLHGRAAHGIGYLEMTGYGVRINLGS